MIKKENRVNEPVAWTVEEFQACLDVYVEMTKLQAKKEKFKKVDFFRELEKKFGRKANQYPLRFQNISFVMEEIGAQVLKGSKPAAGIGGNNRQIVIESYFKTIKKPVPQKWVQTFPEAIKAQKAKEREEKLAKQKAEKEAAKKEAQAKKEAEKAQAEKAKK